MEFTILQATGADRERWRALVEGLQPRLRDLHYWPEYASIYERTYGHRAHLACFGDNDQYVIQPFVVRRLNDLEFLTAQGIEEPLFDIANPYGYGGPLWRAGSDASALGLFARFDQQFREYCRDSGYASEFCSLHPLLGNHELIAESRLLDMTSEKSIAWLDLTLSEAELWRRLSRGHKSSINKARKGGVEVTKVDPNARNLAIFLQLYLATMQRHRAAPKWIFPDGYFAQCVAALSEDRVALFFAWVNGEVAAAYLLLHDPITAYYHFGGSDIAHAALRPSNCLMYESALWAKSSGKLRYHLGGGVTSADDDPLLRFKSGFGGEKSALHVYARVHDECTYRKLVELKCKYEMMTAGRAQNDFYFPRYRQ